MTITTILFYVVVARQMLAVVEDARGRSRCSRCSSSFDLAFFAANAMKIAEAAGSRSSSRVASSRS